jgi:WASH complex subunit 7
MLKSIEVEFKCKKYLINKWVVLVNRFTCEQITRLIESGMPNVYKIKKPNIQQNMLTLIMTILECYKGGYNALRRTVVRHCLNLITEDVFDKAKLSAINDLNWRLGLICNWEVNVRRATRCRFVYWQRSLCPVFFKEIITDKTRLNQMNYYLAALSDPIDMLQNIKHLPSAQIAIENYKKDIYEAFTQHVIRPICAKTEEELRQQIHCILIPNMKQVNPMLTPISDLSLYARMNDLFLFEKQISIKGEIRDYLGHIFYEMSAMSPHDCKTYEHMRVLCLDKLGLNVLQSHLPSQQLEQGLDIMLLLRETDKYVSGYHYNLHTQIFVERTTETKQIKTIGVNQMLYSIRTHGVGIL